MNGKLTLEGGKFWRDGVEVPPRIGDAEQIAFLREIERGAEQRENDANGAGIVLVYSVDEIRYTGEITCICGDIVRNSFECNGFCSDSLDDVMMADSDSHCMKCPSCGRKYEIVFGRAVLIP